ncbi:MAG: DUF4266 domain-containing protein [Luminiphilus sp.]|nr:DUF4266 domain-containing protein [Luminiphilus sp.]
MKNLSILTVLTLSLLSGCAGIEPVPAWERGYLADEGMQWQATAREAKLEGHVYTSKEASTGGAGAAGGGCGCN